MNFFIKLIKIIVIICIITTTLLAKEFTIINKNIIYLRKSYKEKIDNKLGNLLEYLIKQSKDTSKCKAVFIQTKWLSSYERSVLYHFLNYLRYFGKSLYIESTGYKYHQEFCYNLAKSRGWFFEIDRYEKNKVSLKIVKELIKTSKTGYIYPAIYKEFRLNNEEKEIKFNQKNKEIIILHSTDDLQNYTEIKLISPEGKPVTPDVEIKTVKNRLLKVSDVKKGEWKLKINGYGKNRIGIFAIRKERPKSKVKLIPFIYNLKLITDKEIMFKIISKSVIEKEDINIILNKKFADFKIEPKYKGEFINSIVKISGDIIKGENIIEIYYKKELLREERISFKEKPAEIVINEVKPGKNFWVELFCKEGTDVDISKYKLTDLDGRDSELADKPFYVSKGEYIVVRWEEGITEYREKGKKDFMDYNNNGIREIFLKDKTPGLSDEVVLKYGKIVIDAVVYKIEGGSFNKYEKKDISRLEKIGEWTGKPVIYYNERYSIGRADLKDNNKAKDWYMCKITTPGQENKVSPKITEQIPRKGWVYINEVDTKNRWIEIYCRKGEIDLSELIITDLDGKEVRIAEAPLILKNKEYCIIHFKKGITEYDIDINGNGVKDIYLDTQPPSNTDDQIVLMNYKEIIDCVIYNNGDGKISKNEDKDNRLLIEAGFWKDEYKEGEEIGIYKGEKSFGRIGYEFKKDDWSIFLRPTPGKRNIKIRKITGEVIINEIGFEKDYFWVELYCRKGKVDLSRYTLTDLDGEEMIISEYPITLRAGEYGVIYITKKRLEIKPEIDRVGDINKNGYRECVIHRRPPARTDDEIVLKYQGKIIDAVVWCNGDGKISKAEAKDYNFLIKEGIWNYKPQLDSDAVDEEAGIKVDFGYQSIGRINEKWEVFITKTPGRKNKKEKIRIKEKDLIINEVCFASKDFWVELYCNKEKIDISGFKLTDLDGDDQVLSGNEKITLKKGEYAIVYWKDGITETDRLGDINKNGYREIYLKDVKPNITDDQLVLLYGNKVIDGIGWCNYDGRISKAEIEDFKFLIESKIWNIDSTLLFPKMQEFEIETQFIKVTAGGYSIGRIDNPEKKNTKESYTEFIVPTKGKANRIKKIPAKGDLIITEINFRKRDGGFWCKLLCKANNVDISGFILTDLDGEDSRLSDKEIILKEGDEVIVHWYRGEDESRGWDRNRNGMIDLYIDDKLPAYTDDQLVLMYGNKIYDAVVWCNGDGVISESEIKDIKYLVEKGEWMLNTEKTRKSHNNPGNYEIYEDKLINIGYYPTRLKRKSKKDDKNTKEDWEVIRR